MALKEAYIIFVLEIGQIHDCVLSITLCVLDVLQNRPPQSETAEMIATASHLCTAHTYYMRPQKDELRIK
jgi:hypothetical protein